MFLIRWKVNTEVTFLSIDSYILGWELRKRRNNEVVVRLSNAENQQGELPEVPEVTLPPMIVPVVETVGDMIQTHFSIESEELNTIE